MERIEDNREKQIMRTSLLGIVTNIVLVIIKVTLGLISGSIAIMSDGINNLTDSSSSLITIIGTKLAVRPPTKKHPFGYGRIEYLTSLIIAMIVLITGFEMAKTAVENIIHPKAVSFSTLTLVIIGITIFVKIFLGTHTQKVGRRVDSGALVASGIDAKNDAIVSAVTLASALFYIGTGISVDAYAGAIISLFVMKTGIDVLRETLSKILGERGDAELAKTIKSIVNSSPAIISAHDLILHNYGPGTYTGSINVEIDHENNVGDMYLVLHQLQAEIFRQVHAYIVLGIYAVDPHSTVARDVTSDLAVFIDMEPHCISFHAVTVDEEKKLIYFDLVLDYDCSRPEMRNRAAVYIGDRFPDYRVVVTIDTEFA